MQPGEQQLEGEGSERVAKRRRTDSHDRTSGCNTPAAFAEPLYPAGTVLPFPLKNQDGSDWDSSRAFTRWCAPTMGVGSWVLQAE